MFTAISLELKNGNVSFPTKYAIKRAQLFENTTKAIVPNIKNGAERAKLDIDDDI
jgi:hypothetical protein